ncbi:MAG: hypothetical protein HY298_05975 [Verrucomicrobia bacterium]|nr:hypothetical protein [Verrucomicrobiota bacterium]
MAIAAGYNHNLALRSNGTVVAWGRNESGQIYVPLDLTNVIAIAAGDDHSLVLQSNGTFVAWGANDYGQCNVPSGLTNVFAIAAGSDLSLALVTWPVEPPILKTKLSGADLLLSWPAVAQNFTLQTTTNFADPTAWVTNASSITDDGTNKWVTVPATNGAQFFRLKSD